MYARHQTQTASDLRNPLSRRWRVGRVQWSPSLSRPYAVKGGRSMGVRAGRRRCCWLFLA